MSLSTSHRHFRNPVPGEKLDPGAVVEVWLHDEAPALGAGRRFVEVLSYGYRWVRLRAAYGPDTRQAVALDRPTFDQLIYHKETTS